MLRKGKDVSRMLDLRLENNRLKTMDYIKGFSIFSIALMHLLYFMKDMPASVLKLSGIGGTGGHVFFVCSGIGLYLSHLNKKSDFSAFIKNRFVKIYVPYIIVVFIAFLLPNQYSGDDRFAALLSHVFLYKMFLPQYQETFGEHFWFVSTIIQFYFLFMPMYKIKEKLNNNKAFFLIFFAISVFWWILCYKLGVGSVRVWNSFCLQFIWEFAMGFIIAEKFYEGRVFKIRKSLLLIAAVAGIGLQGALAFTSDVLRLFNDVPGVIGYTAMALLLMDIKPIKWLCTKISDFSFEYYLVHMLVFSNIFYFIKPESLPMQIALGLVSIFIALAAGSVYSKIVKKIINKKYFV